MGSDPMNDEPAVGEFVPIEHEDCIEHATYIYYDVTPIPGEGFALNLENVDWDRYPHPTIPLIEVFSVHVNERKGNLYSDIKTRFGSTYLQLYDRKKPEAGHIEPDESEPEDDDLLMLGPNGSNIRANDPVTIFMTFKNDTCKDHLYLTGWSGYSNPSHLNRPIKGIMNGPFGSVTINYAVLSKAVGAKVEVLLLHTRATNVSGSITARNSFFPNIENRSLLYRKKKSSSSTPINVLHWKAIPLSKSLVAVPLPASLIIEVDLFDEENNVSIAKGSVEFESHKKAAIQKYIGDNIKVNVTWNKCFRDED